jgi:lipopolysaccharide export system protein LptA
MSRRKSLRSSGTRWRLPFLWLTPMLAALVALQVHALATDSEQPIEIEADFAEFDDVAGTAIYKGGVIAIQGSIKVTGDVMTVKFTPERDMKEILVDGKPATFRQRPEGKQEDVEGEGLRVEYFLQENLVYVKRNARLREEGKLLSGDEIIYDTARSVVSARRTPAADEKPPAGEATKPKQRVRVVLPPKRDPQSPTGPAPTGTPKASP